MRYLWICCFSSDTYWLASSSLKYCPKYGNKDKMHLTRLLQEKSCVIQSYCLRSQRAVCMKMNRNIWCNTDKVANQQLMWNWQSVSVPSSVRVSCRSVSVPSSVSVSCQSTIWSLLHQIILFFFPTNSIWWPQRTGLQIDSDWISP